MQKQVDITGGIEAMGNIAVYDDDGETLFESYTFSNFTPGDYETRFKNFFINNTGNAPVYVTWNMSDSTLTWKCISPGYRYPTTTPYTFWFDLYIVLVGTWEPYITGIQGASVLIGVGQGVEFYIRYEYVSGGDTSPLTHDLKINFYAEDA
jgi:hypothetical protein